jgi:ribose-phosphate pyrophosphokinase
MKDSKIFATVGMNKLGQEIASYLGVPLGKSKCDTFSDGEKSPQFEETVRGQKVFIVGSSTNDNIMETLLMIDAAKRAAAGMIIVVLPYYGYARQDRKEGIRGPIGARLAGDLITMAGANEIISIDLHAAQIQGFLNIPFDHIEGYTIFLPTLNKLLLTDFIGQMPVICTPDAGGFARAAKFAAKMNVPIVAINKRRDKPNSIGSMELVGDVKGKLAIIVDDMCDTAGTLCKAADYLVEKGATGVIAVTTHPVLSGNALKNVNESKSIKRVLVANTIMKGYTYADMCPKITEVSCASTLAKVINLIALKQSIHEVNLG